MNDTIMVNIGTEKKPIWSEWSMENEVEMYVSKVIRDNCCSLAFGRSTTFDDYKEMFLSGVIDDVLQAYREHRYQKIEDAFYVIGKCSSYLYELRDMHREEHV